MIKNRIIFIVGPTASGKTELAIREAERLETSILSCDSLCVYRGMDIGTAKPDKDEQERVPHFGIDLCEPDTVYSIGEYIAYRDEVLQKHMDQGKPIIVAGGSGFYLKSYFQPVVDEVKIPERINEEVGALSQDQGLAGLLEKLKTVNPEDESFEGLDLRNGRRVEKALIRCLSTGLSYSELRQEFMSLPAPLPQWEKEVWMVSREKDDLQARNEMRVEQMLEAGLIEEVIALRKRGFEKNPSACGAIGYREVLDCLDGRLPEDQLSEQIVIHTNQLMRKQRTWFKHQIQVDREILS